MEKEIRFRAEGNKRRMKFEIQILIGLVAMGLLMKKPDWRTGFFLLLFVSGWVFFNLFRN